MVHFQLLHFPLLLPFSLRVVHVLGSPNLPWPQGVHLILDPRLYLLPSTEPRRPHRTLALTAKHFQVHQLHSRSTLYPHRDHLATGTQRTVEDTPRPICQTPAPIRSAFPALARRCWSPGKHHEEPGDIPFYSGIAPNFFLEI